MGEPEENPRELFEAGMAKHRELAKAREESKRRSDILRRLRIANGFDRLIADLLGGGVR